MAKDPRETRIEDLPGPKSQGELAEMKMPYEEYCGRALDHDTRPMPGTGSGFTNANSNERFLSMDYHIPEMVDVFYRLVKMSDGLTELYRPGTPPPGERRSRCLQGM